MLTNTKNLSPRDIAEIEWFDTHSTDRLTQEELDDLEDSYPTVAYGLVLKNSLRYITIASEIRMDQDSDGTWVEQIPHAAIRKARKLGQRNPHKT